MNSLKNRTSASLRSNELPAGSVGVQALADSGKQFPQDRRLKPRLQPKERFISGGFHHIALLLVTLSFPSTPGISGEYNSVLNIGDPAPDWIDLPTTDDTTISLSDFDDADVVVIAFICNSCPYAVDAEMRLTELHNFTRKKDNQANVVVVAVNVNLIDEDALPAMTTKANEQKFPFHYAFDESQQIAKDFGAKYTPEFFVLGRVSSSGQRKIAYMGSLDDSPDGSNVTKRYVHDAVESLLAGRSIEVTETVPIGCRIRMKRQRRSRSK